ncbi:hypothetical protein GQ43DRAFT_465219 [Delitschia confertaspora ATCC 74209]|uniref:Asteroid domain-containing protein n=1 Tax=Delitschia confertaspora ATCC 74209 TaxID=1513339 RepID=A0A9P4JLH2_9PLEO|nr:hypothetical protein GQ43DRAFT_465219 [Delitschia confertaspora ATCC 74209]
MGIQGLTKFIKPYATQYRLEKFQGNEKAIIDGPALAHYAYDMARELDDLSPGRDEMSYLQVNNAAIEFLRTLEKSNIKIAQIFFDGLLPTSKIPERMERLRTKLGMLTQAQNAGLYPSLRRLESRSRPLIVASVLEALRRSEYASVVRMVPGEADVWCANSAYIDCSSIIFTNDSDLLVYETGPETFVAFFRDLHHPLKELVFYQPAAIAKDIGVDTLAAPAYVLMKYPRATDKGYPVLNHARNLGGLKLFDALKQEYSHEEVSLATSASISSTIRINMDQALQQLDPHVSELVLQVLAGCTAPKESKWILNMYLPFLVEDTTAFATWSLGREVRAIGYSLLIPSTPKEVLVNEVMRRVNDIIRKPIEIFSAEKLLDECLSLRTDIQRWMDQYHFLPVSRGWRLYAVKRVLEEMSDNQFARINYDLVAQSVRGEYHMEDWSLLHFKANVDAVLYSILILRQCASVFLAADQGVFGIIEKASVKKVKQLHKVLQTLPTIPELFPTRHARTADPFPHDGLRTGIKNLLLDVTKWRNMREDVGPSVTEEETADGREDMAVQGSDVEMGEDGVKHSEEGQEGYDANVGMEMTEEEEAGMLFGDLYW